MLPHIPCNGLKGLRPRKISHDRNNQILLLHLPDKLVVCVGSLAGRWVPKVLSKLADSVRRNGDWVLDIKTITVKHPAAILRENITSQPLSVRHCEVAIADAFEEVFGGDHANRHR